MKKIVKESLPLRRYEASREEALALMEEKGEEYKAELIRELPCGEAISFYQQGEYTDLCAGPHVSNTSLIRAFKLTGEIGRASCRERVFVHV